MAATKKSAAKTAKPAENPLVNQALKASWERDIRRYRQAREAASSSWDDRYEALGDILEFAPPSYLAGGYATVKAFLAAEAPGETVRSVQRAIRVAKHFESRAGQGEAPPGGGEPEARASDVQRDGGAATGWSSAAGIASCRWVSGRGPGVVWRPRGRP